MGGGEHHEDRLGGHQKGVDRARHDSLPQTRPIRSLVGNDQRKGTDGGGSRIDGRRIERHRVDHHRCQHRAQGGWTHTARRYRATCRQRHQHRKAKNAVDQIDVKQGEVGRRPCLEESLGAQCLSPHGVDRAAGDGAGLQQTGEMAEIFPQVVTFGEIIARSQRDEQKNEDRRHGQPSHGGGERVIPNPPQGVPDLSPHSPCRPGGDQAPGE